MSTSIVKSRPERRHDIPSNQLVSPRSQVCVEEVQKSLVTTSILLLHLRILKVSPVGTLALIPPLQRTLVISPGSHPSMHLGREPLDDMLNLQFLLILANGILILVLARQHRNGDGDLRRIAWIHHSRVHGGSSLKGCSLLARQVHDLATPAVAHYAPLGGASLTALECFQHLGDSGERLGRRCFVVEEGTELLAFLLYISTCD